MCRCSQQITHDTLAALAESTCCVVPVEVGMVCALQLQSIPIRHIICNANLCIILDYYFAVKVAFFCSPINSLGLIILNCMGVKLKSKRVDELTKEGLGAWLFSFTKQIKRLHWRLSMIKSVNLHKITNRHRVLEQCADVFHAAHNRP